MLPGTLFAAQLPRRSRVYETMYKTTSIFATVILSLGLAATAAAAPAKTPRVDHRQVKQQVRIVQGVKTGALTPREAARLERGQRHVVRAERRAKADGTVTAAERARIEHKQDKQSARIHRQKHDAQKR